jgi:hypothetical protein
LKGSFSIDCNKRTTKEMAAPPPPPPSREHRKTLSSHPAVDHSHSEHQQEEVPTEIENGVELTDQTAAPDHYRWYKVKIPGTENDMVEFHVSRTVQVKIKLKICTVALIFIL